MDVAVSATHTLQKNHFTTKAPRRQVSSLIFQPRILIFDFLGALVMNI
jgi:hypothetical protein